MDFTPTSTHDERLHRAVNSLKNIDIQLSPGARRRLALECRRNIERGAVSDWGSRLRSFLLFQLPRRATAAALGLSVVVGISSLFLSERQDWDLLRGAHRSEVSLVSIQPVRQGGVLLEWRDGTQDRFWVLKSSNPRDFSKAERYSVVGTRWMDLDPGKGQVTYYRVE
ncbi:MAG TPA: hypothetical protein VFW45_17045 [Candidatus Polarisedimenticolia bacterium]|nr:hypothetical protein [Candidatus Polarisedimenticolia bacterium]